MKKNAKDTIIGTIKIGPTIISVVETLDKNNNVCYPCLKISLWDTTLRLSKNQVEQFAKVFETLLSRSKNWSE